MRLLPPLSQGIIKSSTLLLSAKVSFSSTLHLELIVTKLLIITKFFIIISISNTDIGTHQSQVAGQVNKDEHF